MDSFFFAFYDRLKPMRKNNSLFKKILSAIFLSFISVFLLPAADGVMWGEKNIRVIQTQWFDIIYPESSAESAALLYENADRIYSEIAELYGREPQVRMPVVLSPKTEQFNAYFTASYYNHIVIYDTAVSEDLSVFTNDLLSTFRHELTHAYTYNIKNGFWSVIGNIFGDMVNPAYLFVTPGLAEGATLTSEASKGEGRLNDEFSRQMVKQAKIENQFPAFADVQGASDVYPSGSFYYFNGAFDQWLQKTYGMEKYAAWWYKLVNFQTISQSLTFKNVYGVSVRTAWNQFREEYEIPENIENPLESEILSASDFFTGSRETYSQKNNGGALYSSLTSDGKNFLFIEKKSHSVWLSENPDFPGNRLNLKKIFTLYGIQKIHLSEDGKFLTVVFIDTGTPVYTMKVKIYDMEKRKFLHQEFESLYDSIVVKKQGQYYLVSQGFKSQKKWLDVRKLFDENSEEIKKLPFEKNAMALNFCSLGEDRFAYVLREGLSYKLVISNLDGSLKDETVFPFNDISVRGLAFDSVNEKLLFSYTQTGTMPRLGSYDLKNEKFFLSKTDVSGGIFEPVSVKDRLIFAGHFYRQNRLFVSDYSEEEFYYPKSQVQFAAENSENQNNRETYVELASPAEEILKDSKKYNPFKYLTRGLFLPVGLVESYNFEPGKMNNGSTESLVFGATYFTGNPWTSNNLVLSAGYSPFTNSFGLQTQLNGGTDTSLLAWTAFTSLEFDMKGFKQAALNVSGSLDLLTGSISSLIFSNNLQALYGKSNAEEVSFMDFSALFNSGYVLDRWLNLREKADLTWTNVHKTGPGIFENGGVSFSLTGFYGFVMNTEINAYKAFSFYSLGLSGKFYIPKLIPIESRDSWVYNLPVNITAEFLPDEKKFMNAAAAVSLFDKDFQKAVPFIPGLFVRRFYVTSGYSFSVLYENRKYETGFLPLKAWDNFQKLGKGKLPFADFAFLRLNLNVGPNFGTFANSNIDFVIHTGFRIDIRDEFRGKPDFNFELGVKTSL